MLTTVEQLQAKMKKDKISVPKLSKYLEIPQDRIYSWFRGKGNPKSEDAKKVEEFLGIGTNTKSKDQKDQSKNTVSEAETQYNMNDNTQSKEDKYLAILQNCSEAARDAAKAAKESAQTLNKMVYPNSEIPVEEKIDELSKEIYSMRVGMVANRNRLIRDIAKRDNRSFDDVMDDFLDNDLAEAAGRKAASSQSDADKKSKEAGQAVES